MDEFGWVARLFLYAPALLCAARAAGRTHCPIAFGLCGLTLSWGAVPMVWMVTRAPLPDDGSRLRRLTEGRLHAAAQLLGAAALATGGLAACYPLSDQGDIRHQSTSWASLVILGYAFGPSLLWLARPRPRRWWSPLAASEALSELQREELEGVAAAAAAVRVSYACTLAVGALTAFFLKCALCAPLYQITG